MKTASFLLLSLCPSLATAQSLPRSEAESLAGRELMLPGDLAGKPAIVVWSFSKDAGQSVKDWVVPLHREALPVWKHAGPTTLATLRQQLSALQ